MVKRGHEVDLEYSKKKIINKMNDFFGFSVVEKLRLISFDDEKEINSKENNNIGDVTKKKYYKKIFGVKNNEIKKSLIELLNVYKEK